MTYILAKCELSSFQETTLSKWIRNIEPRIRSGSLWGNIPNTIHYSKTRTYFVNDIWPARFVRYPLVRRAHAYNLTSNRKRTVSQSPTLERKARVRWSEVRPVLTGESGPEETVRKVRNQNSLACGFFTRLLDGWIMLIEYSGGGGGMISMCGKPRATFFKYEHLRWSVHCIHSLRMFFSGWLYEPSTINGKLTLMPMHNQIGSKWSNSRERIPLTTGDDTIYNTSSTFNETWQSDFFNWRWKWTT